MARAMLLHSSAHWKQGIDSSLWPMAVNYATHIYNTTPKENGVCPADIFLGTTVPRHRLQHLHAWGCPVYVLDPTLANGSKLPRWQPKSRLGIFVGMSTFHSSDVPLVLNLQTGYITAQFHVVFDDLFSTVASIGREEEPPSHWQDLCLHSHYVATDDDHSHLEDQWLTPQERESKRRQIEHETKVRTTFEPKQQAPAVAAPAVAAPTAPVTTDSTTSDTVTAPAPTIASTATPNAPPTTVPPVQPPSAAQPPTGLRRSSRESKGQFNSTRYIVEQAQQSNSTFVDWESHQATLAYHAEVVTDYDTGELNIADPRVYAAKVRRNDPDNPSFKQATEGPHASEYIEAMKLEVATLVSQRAWTAVSRKEAVNKGANILKGTWCFKLKRLPDGAAYRFKARYCARGDLQQEGVDFFETYAPVVQWSTIRLLLSTVLTEGWATRQVDYTNAFAQATLKEEVYLERPRMFSPKNRKDTILKLNKSLYGLRQSPRTFFEMLRDGLLERDYTQSAHDPCLFMKKGIICVVYVDDTIFASADDDFIQAEMRGLGIKQEGQVHEFKLRDEGEVGAFLGIQITKTGPCQFYLTQTGLVDKVLKTAGMEDCRGQDTPASTTSLGTDKDGAPFEEDWEYASVVGMLMYLSANSRPDITYAVHSVARFSHSPRASHAMAVKKILRYLKKTKDKGLTLEPKAEHTVDCYVDADFGGLFSVEDSESPVSVKSRTGYVIMYRGSPLLWASKLQTQIALSTMESEYIALSQSMRDLIPIREILKEILEVVFDRADDVKYTTHSRAFEDIKDGNQDTPLIPKSKVYEDNEACLKFARMAKLSPRTKHIGVPYHWFRTKVESLEIEILPIDTNDQLADQFTKGLVYDKFVRARNILMGW
jgi:hypothetical protein